MNRADAYLCDKWALAIVNGTADRSTVLRFVRKYRDYDRNLVGAVLPEAVYRIIMQREKLGRHLNKTPEFTVNHALHPDYLALTNVLRDNGHAFSAGNIVRPMTDYNGEELELSFCAPWTMYEAAKTPWVHVNFPPEPEPEFHILGPDFPKVCP